MLANPQVFCSGQGLGLTDTLNHAWTGMAPTLDGGEYAPLRLVMMQTIGPKAVAGWQAQIEAIARDLVEEVMARGEFDLVTDFAQLIPVRSVVDILGISPDLETRLNLLHWATDAYHCCGPAGTYDHTLPSMEKLYGYALSNLARDKVRPGSVGDLTYQAVGAGTITEAQALGIIAGYFTAGLDTTAAGIGNLCMGEWLSNMEVHALMGEFVRRVDAIESTGEPVRVINNLIRSLDSLPVRVRVR